MAQRLRSRRVRICVSLKRSVGGYSLQTLHRSFGGAMQRLGQDLRCGGRMSKNKLFRARTVVALIILVSAIWLSTLARLTWRPLPATVEASSAGRSDGGDLQLLAPLACTIFTAAYCGTGLFWNYEESINP